MRILNKIFGKSSSEQKFWEWFAKNSTRLYTAEGHTDDVCRELEEEMHKVHKDLAYSFGPIKDERREFIVSADGMLSVFPAVQRLANAAPDLPSWHITAFRPATGPSIIRVGSCSLRPSDIFFLAEAQDKKLNLTLFIKDLDRHDEQSLSSAVFLCLDAILGEYDAQMKIGMVGWKPLPDGPSRDKLYRIEKLPEITHLLLDQTT
ncbi:MAG: hypothetical protein WCT06_00905 [Armatimonadota bacterium]|jgi:hypothetical protein|nr:hypothetical protein [Armatimonadota bacterium]